MPLNSKLACYISPSPALLQSEQALCPRPALEKGSAALQLCLLTTEGTLWLKVTKDPYTWLWRTAAYLPCTH